MKIFKKITASLVFVFIANTQARIIHQGEFDFDRDSTNKGTVTFASVGPAAECTHSTIQVAIDAGVDEVRLVASHVYNEDVVISARNILLRGNFASCIDANSNNFLGDDDAIINGQSGAGAVMVIAAAALKKANQKGGATPKIRLENIEIRGGTAGFASGGGIYMQAAAVVDLDVSYSYIHNNTAFSGGGISVNSHSQLFLYDNSVSNNMAQYGGGIYCNNSNSRVSLLGSNITLNTAFKSSGIENGKGGGIYLTNNCRLNVSNLYASSDVSLNQAEGQGGGIYAESGAQVTLNKTLDCLAGYGSCVPLATNLIGNISDSDNSGNENGGGVYLTGANTRLTITDGNIVGNKTGGHGGAIAAENDAIVSIQRSSSRCWNPAHCVFFSANKAGEQNFGAGGAIFNSSATVTINQATFEDNRADFGTVIYATGLNSTTTINSSIFNHNGAGGGNSGANGFSDNYVIRALSDAVVHVLSSTIADNDVTLGVIGISASTTASSTVYSSIIYDAASGSVFALGSAGYLTDCDLVHETGSFLSSGTSSVGNPMFVNSASRNYHIQVNSPAVDGCDNFHQAGDVADIDNESRGYDDPNHANPIGPYDIGADETLESDIIFKHGFEL